jgi:hypothetical protein
VRAASVESKEAVKEAGMVWAGSALMGVRFVIGSLLWLFAVGAFASFVGGLSRTGDADLEKALIALLSGALASWSWPSQEYRQSISTRMRGQTPPAWLLPVLAAVLLASLITTGVVVTLSASESARTQELEIANTILVAESESYERAARQLATLVCAAGTQPGSQCEDELVRLASQQ